MWLWQLIRATDGYHIWSKSWDRQGHDVLAMETDVASAVAESFRQTLRGSKPVATSLEAHDLYLLGRHHWNTLEPGELFKAINYFERAIAIAPDYALAYSGLSEAYSYLIDLDVAPVAEMTGKARTAAEKAISLDEGLAEAHTSLGLALMDGEWDMVAAEREFRRAVQLKPRFAYGVHWLGHFLENKGMVEEGYLQMRQAAAIDPLSRMYQLDIAMSLYKKRQIDQGLTQVQKARELDAAFPFFDMADAIGYAAKKDWARAVESSRKARTVLGPLPFVIAMQAIAEGGSGNLKGAGSRVKELSAQSKTGYVPAFAFALSSYAAGEKAMGYSWLRRAFEERNCALLWLGSSPMFDVVREDAAGAELLKHVGDRGYVPAK